MNVLNWLHSKGDIFLKFKPKKLKKGEEQEVLETLSRAITFLHHEMKFQLNEKNKSSEIERFSERHS